MAYENKDEVALWKNNNEDGTPKLSKDGQVYWSGNATVGGKQFKAVMFFTKAENKKNPKQPDFKILLSEKQA
jgi:hypothetical protein